MFCKHCGTQIPDESVFCPNCGGSTAARANGQTGTDTNGSSYQQPTGAYEQPAQPQGQPGYQQGGGYQQPQGYYGQRKPASPPVDVMSLVSLCMGAVGLIMGLAAIVKGARSMSSQGIIQSIMNMFNGGGSGVGNIVLAIVAAAICAGGFILARRQIQSVGSNTFNSLGKILSLVGFFLALAGLIFAIIGKVKSKKAANYSDYLNQFGGSLENMFGDLGNLFEDLF